MADRPFRIELTLRGPAVAEWIVAHLRDPSGGMMNIVHANAYEAYITWRLPAPQEVPNQTVRLLAHAVRAFKETVPDGAALLEKHKSDLRIEITGGPR